MCRQLVSVSAGTHNSSQRQTLIDCTKKFPFSNTANVAFLASAIQSQILHLKSPNIHTANEHPPSPLKPSPPISHPCFFLLGSPCALLAAISPSASHLLALTSCTTFNHCLNSITGDDTAAIAQGTLLSILFARASSMAQALPGAAKKAEAGWEGEPGWVEERPGPVGRREGESMGEEKERR